MRTALILAAALALGTPAAAEPPAQFVASVQQRLDRLGFGAVDARTLSTRQLAALHLELQGRAMAFGLPRMNTRQKVTIILGWEAEGRRSY